MVKFWKPLDLRRPRPGNNHYLQHTNRVRFTGTSLETSYNHFSLLPIPSSDRRTSAWLKLKKDYVTGLGDTLDVVPIGAWHGYGRKAQWWSPVLVAVRDTSLDRFVAICKCMSGESAASGT